MRSRRVRKRVARLFLCICRRVKHDCSAMNEAYRCFLGLDPSPERSFVGITGVTHGAQREPILSCVACDRVRVHAEAPFAAAIFELCLRIVQPCLFLSHFPLLTRRGRSSCPLIMTCPSKNTVPPPNWIGRQQGDSVPRAVWHAACQFIDKRRGKCI